MRKGFTLIEVLVVAVIVAILAAVAIPAYSGYIQSSKERVATNIAATIASALAAYYSEYPDFRVTEAMNVSGSEGGLVNIGGGNSVRIPADHEVTLTNENVTVGLHSDSNIEVEIRWKEGG